MEMWDIYDINRYLKNKTAIRSTKMLPEGDYNLAVDVWIINSKGEHLVQKRTPNKVRYPNYWECAAGGAVIAGENSLQGVARELEEELGILPDLSKAKKVFEFIRDDSHVDVWLIREDFEIDKLKLQQEEVSEVKWVKTEEIYQMLKDGVFIPTIMPGFEKILEII